MATMKCTKIVAPLCLELSINYFWGVTQIVVMQ
jgi:hypothetical protein